MLELIFIRHGETDGNIRQTYLGWTDTGLNENGIRQVQLLRDRLKDTKIDGIFSSPLKRTMETAKIINENYKLDIKYSEGLKERNFGVWDDLTLKEITDKYPLEYSQWTNDWIKYRIKDGESAQEAYDRSVTFIKAILKSGIEGSILCVTHLGTIRFILAYLLDLGIENSWRFRVGNASITRVEIKEGYGVLTMLNG